MYMNFYGLPIIFYLLRPNQLEAYAVVGRLHEAVF